MLVWKGVDSLWKTIQRMILATITATQTAMKMVQIYGNALVRNVLNESAARAAPRGPRVLQVPLAQLVLRAPPALPGPQGRLARLALQGPPARLVLQVPPVLPGPQGRPARLVPQDRPVLRALQDPPALRALQDPPVRLVPQGRPAQLVHPALPVLQALRVPLAQLVLQVPPVRRERPLL